MADKLPTPTGPSVDGLISMGYEAPDYNSPSGPGPASKAKTHTVYPTFRVCEGPAEALHEALTAGKLLDGEFAAIVVLKNNMVRVSDEDEDEDAEKDVELEFTVKALMPHVDEGKAETEDAIMADFEQLPKAKKEPADAEEEPEE